MASKAIPVRLSVEVIAQLDALAGKTGESRSALMVRFIVQGLGGETAPAVVVKAGPKPSPGGAVVLKRVAPGPVGVTPEARRAPALTPAGGADRPVSDRLAAVRAVRCSTPDPVVPGSRLKRTPAPRR